MPVKGKYVSLKRYYELNKEWKSIDAKDGRNRTPLHDTIAWLNGRGFTVAKLSPTGEGGFPDETYTVVEEL